MSINTIQKAVDYTQKLSSKIASVFQYSTKKRIYSTIEDVSNTTTPETTEELFTLGAHLLANTSDIQEWKNEIMNCCLINETLSSNYSLYKSKIQWRYAYANATYIVLPVGDGGLVFHRQNHTLQGRYTMPDVLCEEPKEEYPYTVDDIRKAMEQLQYKQYTNITHE